MVAVSRAESRLPEHRDYVLRAGKIIPSGVWYAGRRSTASVSSLRPRQAPIHARSKFSLNPQNCHESIKTALNKRAYPDALRNYDEHSPAQPAPAFTLYSAKSVAFIERHGECDLPTRRHAEESRPAPLGSTHCVAKLFPVR